MGNLVDAAAAAYLRGKKIGRVRLNGFADGRGGRAYMPEILLASGDTLRFTVVETEVGEYGVRLVVVPGFQPTGGDQ